MLDGWQRRGTGRLLLFSSFFIKGEHVRTGSEFNSKVWSTSILCDAFLRYQKPPTLWAALAVADQIKPYFIHNENQAIQSR